MHKSRNIGHVSVFWCGGISFRDWKKNYKNIDILREAGLKKKIIAEKVGYSSRQGLDYAIKDLKFRDNILELNQKLEVLISTYVIKS